jgi:glycosyltransferase involved in cell wall biosynthesis
MLPRLALLPVFAEEQWPSMDLCAEMLLRHLQGDAGAGLDVHWYQPQYRRRFGRLPWLGRRKVAVNADRLLNRQWYYSRAVRGLSGSFDLFHVCDHSYANLVHALPPERTGVFCQDLETFRCVLDPQGHPRPRWFRAQTRRILRGLQEAAVVFHSTALVRKEIERYGLVRPERLVAAPLGVAPEFSHPLTPEEARGLLPAQLQGSPFLLHVGSCIPRKRMDVLLDTFAAARAAVPGLKLVKVGGPWTAEQRAMIDRLGLAGAVVQLTGLVRAQIAALYNQAALVLLPSDAEGFGLPVIEALASGGVVVASDIEVLREVGGAAVVYCPPGNAEAWTGTVVRLLNEPATAPEAEVRRAQAAKFSWDNHARIIAATYRRLAEGTCAA